VFYILRFVRLTQDCLFFVLDSVMMAVVSVVAVRYRWTLFPALAFLAFIAFRIHSVAAGTLEVASPFMIGAGMVVMHQSQDNGWLLYWLGESLVIGMFTYNSMSGLQKTTPLYVGIGLFSCLAALWFRGKFWNYVIVLGLELFLAIFIAMAFPIMEMVLEAILNDKLRKVGDKVRAHHQHLERYYNSKR
jgi:multisubunit Na+/H+ antiporter MnhG subunit